MYGAYDRQASCGNPGNWSEGSVLFSEVSSFQGRPYRGVPIRYERVQLNTIGHASDVCVCVVCCVCRNKEPQSVGKDWSGVFDSITASTAAQSTSNNTSQLSLPLTHTPLSPSHTHSSLSLSHTLLSLPLTHTPQTTTAHTAPITPANLIS